MTVGPILSLKWNVLRREWKQGCVKRIGKCEWIENLIPKALLAAWHMTCWFMFWIHTFTLQVLLWKLFARWRHCEPWYIRFPERGMQKASLAEWSNSVTTNSPHLRNVFYDAPRWRPIIHWAIRHVRLTRRHIMCHFIRTVYVKFINRYNSNCTTHLYELLVW